MRGRTGIKPSTVAPKGSVRAKRKREGVSQGMGGGSLGKPLLGYTRRNAALEGGGARPRSVPAQGVGSVLGMRRPIVMTGAQGPRSRPGDRGREGTAVCTSAMVSFKRPEEMSWGHKRQDLVLIGTKGSWTGPSSEGPGDTGGPLGAPTRHSFANGL